MSLVKFSQKSLYIRTCTLFLLPVPENSYPELSIDLFPLFMSK